LVIFSSSIAIAVFPFFSSQVAENKIEEMKNSITKSIRMSGFIFIPLTVILVILAKPIIRLLFQRGMFDSHATNLTSVILICYSFQFFFYTVGMILGRVFLAFQDANIILMSAIISATLNIFFNFLFVKIITPPAAGIALSTSMVYFIVTLCLFLLLKKRKIYLHGKYILDGIIKTGVSSIIAGIGVTLVFYLCKKMIILPSIMNQIIRLGIISAIGIIIFVVCSLAFRIEEIYKLKEIIYSKIK